MKPYRYWRVNADKTNSLFVIHVSGGSDMTGHALPETRSVFPQDTRTGEVETGSEAVRDEANMGGTVKASTEINNTTYPTSSLGESSNVGAKKVDGQVGGGEALEAALCQLGPFGSYQRYVLTLLCLPTLLSAMYSFNYVFVAEQVPFRCVVPECEGVGASFGNTSTLALLSPEPCRRYAPLSDAPTCLREDFHLNNTIKCEAFIYENQNTIYAEFGLACREWLRTLVGSVRNAALPLALLLTGYTSDRWGRLTAFCIFSACAGVLGLIKSFSVNYQMYIALEFLEAALGYGFGSAAYVMGVFSPCTLEVSVDESVKRIPPF
ncbi:unnamed protein product [Parnassius apollo]|uniref:(apollo) hypothetical protein n=1 Tax=Parnassius apollo TaxID=110799 RepID=A0A8S3Y649_PARAO|nr:unnamed protein product [Parnassius apollo]